MANLKPHPQHVHIPEDRTNKQPVRAICRNPECLEHSSDPHFEFTAEHSQIVCPKCAANRSPMVGMLVLIHYLYRDRDGCIDGEGGLTYSLACDTKRAYMATVTNQEAATGEFSAVNCPGCIEAVKKKNLRKKTGWALLQNPAEAIGPKESV